MIKKNFFRAYFYSILLIFSFASFLNAEETIDIDPSLLIEAEAAIKDPNTLLDKKTSKISNNKEIDNNQSEIKKLKQQLQKTQSKLHLAEAESRRLNKLLNKDYKSSLVSYGIEKKETPKSTTKVVKARKTRKIRKLPTSSRSEMQIATVRVEKANLRTGPGKKNSPIMSVSKGTRLAIETRLDDWYRVITPTGTRAWILSDLVAFGRNYRSKYDRVVKVKGYQKDAFN